MTLSRQVSVVFAFKKRAVRFTKIELGEFGFSSINIAGALLVTAMQHSKNLPFGGLKIPRSTTTRLAREIAMHVVWLEGAKRYMNTLEIGTDNDTIFNTFPIGNGQ